MLYLHYSFTFINAHLLRFVSIK